MTILNKSQVLSKIANLVFKDGTNLTEIISDIVIKNNNIGFAINITRQNKLEAEIIRNKATCEIQQLKGVSKVTIVLTSSKDEGTQAKDTKPKHHIEGVSKIILVASGKGGVGKSTMAALLAQQLASEGLKVGIIDADIYGPSIPQIFGINKRPVIVDKKMIPLEAKGIQIISIGFLIKENDAVAWRGPMASKAIYQLLSLTKWDNLDYLIIDMPPGTGDIHLGILENYHLDGVVMVTTPQKIAELDVKKAIELYKKFGLPILGIIENMSYFTEPVSGHKITIFSGEGGTYLSEYYNIPLISQLPIIPQLTTACDAGESLVKYITLPRFW